MIRIVFSFFLILAVTVPGYSQSVPMVPDPVLARVGDQIITGKDFTRRWELSPQVGREQAGKMTESRKKLLYTLVSEKLIAFQGEELGIDTTWLFRRQLKSMEEIWIRDQVYKADIESRVNVTPAMLQEALRRSESWVKVNFLHSGSEDSIRALRVLILAGTPFDSLLKNRPEKKEQPGYFEVTYGKMEPEAEDAVFKLSKGEISQPVKRPNGYFVFYCRETGNYPPKTGEALKALERKLRDMVHIRESDTYYQEFMRSFFKGKNLTTDGKLYKSLSNKLADRLSFIFSTLNTKKIDKPVGLPAEQYQEIEKEFGPDSLNMRFIKYDPYPVTLRDFLYDLQFRGFGVTSGNKSSIKKAFHSTVEIMVRDAAIHAEGYKRGYQNNPEVKSYLEEHRMNTLSEKVKGRVFSKVSVSDSEIKEAWEKQIMRQADTLALNALEIQTSSEDQVQLILAELQAGTDFISVAERYNENGILAERKFETGFFVPSQRPLAGQNLAGIEPGEVTGPVRQGSLYSIFKLLDKKRVFLGKNDPQKPLDQVYTEVKAKLWEKKYLKNLTELTLQSAKKHGLELDEKALDSLPLTSVNLAAFQEMGFGGKIMAAPYTSEFTEWVTDWKKSETPAP